MAEFDSSDNGYQLGRRVFRWRCGVKTLHIGEQNQKIGARHRGDAGGEAVVVAIANFVCRDSIVLIDHRHRAQIEKAADRRPCIEITLALLRVPERDKNLTCGKLSIRENFRPNARQGDLPDGGGGLAVFKFEVTFRQAEHGAPQRDRAR